MEEKQINHNFNGKWYGYNGSEWQEYQEPSAYTSPYKDYNHTGPVWKDDTTKDLLRQIDDSNAAFKVAMLLMLLSIIFNIALAYQIAKGSH